MTLLQFREKTLHFLAVWFNSVTFQDHRACFFFLCIVENQIVSNSKAINKMNLCMFPSLDPLCLQTDSRCVFIPVSELVSRTLQK